MVSEELVTSLLRCCTSVVGFFVPTTPDRLRNFTIKYCRCFPSTAMKVTWTSILWWSLRSQQGSKALRSVSSCVFVVFFHTFVVSQLGKKISIHWIIAVVSQYIVIYRITAPVLRYVLLYHQILTDTQPCCQRHTSCVCLSAFSWRGWSESFWNLSLVRSLWWEESPSFLFVVQ